MRSHPITEQDIPDLLTVAEVAAYLHVHAATVRRLLAGGQLDYTRLGAGRGRIAIPKRAVLDYVNRNAVRHNRPAS